MITKLINKLTKKQRIISMILLIFVVLFFIISWFFFIKKTTYKITFYPENGAKAITERINEGNHVDIPSQPFLDGYEFQYWSEDLSEPFDFNQRIVSDHKLYAVYLKICNIEFICDGKDYSTDKVLEGNLVKTPPEPIKSGFSFSYWEYNGSQFDFSTPIKEDMSLLAKFVTRIPCQTVSFSEDTIYVSTEESFLVDINIEPADCTDKPVIQIDDALIAEVNSDNTIIGVNPGQTRITVLCGERRSEAVLICAEEADYIILSSDQYIVDVGESVDVKATVEPVEASVYRLKYSVEDANIAFINEKGIITGRNGGTTKITVTSSNGRSTSAQVFVNGASLELSGLPSSFYTSYSPDSTEYPVRLLYTEWKNGIKKTDSNCEGALLQCSIDAVEYKDGYIIQNKPVDFTMSSEIFFTYMTCKSNSCFVICEPNIEIKDTENLSNITDSEYKANSSDIAAQITMNCSGTWTVLKGGANISFSSDPVSCTFIPADSEIILRFISTGGQSIDIKIFT